MLIPHCLFSSLLTHKPTHPFHLFGSALRHIIKQQIIHIAKQLILNSLQYLFCRYSFVILLMFLRVWQESSHDTEQRQQGTDMENKLNACAVGKPTKESRPYPR